MIWHRILPTVLFAISLGSCETWRASTLGPRDLIDQQHPTSIRVARERGELLVVREPRIVRDSLAFVSGPCQRLPGRTAGYRCPTTAVLAVDEVYVLQVPAADHKGTLLLLIPVAAFVGYAVSWEIVN
jgi:hypothetical protein